MVELQVVIKENLESVDLSVEVFNLEFGTAPWPFAFNIE
jgi:hypothetical protein